MVMLPKSAPSLAVNRVSKISGICCLRVLVFLARNFVISLMIVWVARAPLLAGLTKVWIVDDEITPADAVVVLGGGV